MATGTIPATAADPLGEMLFSLEDGHPLIWTPLDPSGNTVWDRHPRGEGNPETREVLVDDAWRKKRLTRFEGFRRVRMPRSEVENWLRRTEIECCDDEGNIDEQIPGLRVLVPVKRIAPAGLLARKTVGLVPGAKCRNLHALQLLDAVGMVEPTDYETMWRERAARDTRRNAEYTIGPEGGDYATHAAWVSAASSGDAGREIENAAYVEAVDLGTKSLRLIAGGGGRPKIAPATGTGFRCGGAAYSFVYVEGYDIESADSNALYSGYASGTYSTHGEYRGLKIVAPNTGYGCYFKSALEHLIADSIIYNAYAGIGMAASYTGGSARHVTCVDCAQDGFHGYDATYKLRVTDCLAQGSGNADFSNCRDTNCASGDATATGAGSVTGFARADFNDPDNDDFTLKAANKDTTAAKMEGCPSSSRDFAGDLRKTTNGEYWAGALAPDPLYSPDNAVVPTTAQVQSGVDFGPVTGAEYTGTYAPSAPAAPDIAVARASDTSCTVTFSNSAAGKTNEVRYATIADGGDTWTDGGSRTGDGDVTVAGLTSGQAYFFVGFTDDGGAYSEPSNVVIYTSGPASGAVGAYAEFLEDLYDEVRNSAALAAKVTDGAPADHVKLGRFLNIDSEGKRHAALIPNGPVLYLEPRPYSKAPRSGEHSRCEFAAALQVFEQYDSSSADTLVTALNFVEALTKEVLAESDGAGSSWAGRGYDVRVAVDGPREIEGLRDELVTSVTVSAKWTEEL